MVCARDCELVSSARQKLLAVKAANALADAALW
jgi:hypothetical protein